MGKICDCTKQTAAAAAASIPALEKYWLLKNIPTSQHPRPAKDTFKCFRTMNLNKSVKAQSSIWPNPSSRLEDLHLTAIFLNNLAEKNAQEKRRKISQSRCATPIKTYRRRFAADNDSVNIYPETGRQRSAFFVCSIKSQHHNKIVRKFGMFKWTDHALHRTTLPPILQHCSTGISLGSRETCVGTVFCLQFQKIMIIIKCLTDGT